MIRPRNTIDIALEVAPYYSGHRNKRITYVIAPNDDIYICVDNRCYNGYKDITKGLNTSAPFTYVTFLRDFIKTSTFDIVKNTMSEQKLKETIQLLRKASELILEQM